MSYTYAQAERILAIVFNCEDRQKTMFRGRMKHLQRLGIPLGMHPGRGKKVRYSWEHLLQWMYLLECSSFGLEPSLIASCLPDQWAGLMPVMERAESSAVWLWFYPEPMSDNGLVARWHSQVAILISEASAKEFRRVCVLCLSESIRRMRSAECQVMNSNG